MNKNLLESEMKKHGDTGTMLASFLGMARSTFSAKINETNGAEFTQSILLMQKKLIKFFLIQKCLNKILQIKKRKESERRCFLEENQKEISLNQGECQ